MKFKTVAAWAVKVTVMVAAPGGFFLAGYEAWKWWKHRHDQKPQPQPALENKAGEEAKVPQENVEVSEEKVN